MAHNRKNKGENEKIGGGFHFPSAFLVVNGYVQLIGVLSFYSYAR